MSDPPNHQQEHTQASVEAQQDEAMMHAHLAQYTRALHDYTLALWTESRRVAQEKEKMVRERRTGVLASAGLPAGSEPTPTLGQPHASPFTTTSAQTTAPQSVMDDTTPKAVTPPRVNPVDSAQKTPTPPPASS